MDNKPGSYDFRTSKLEAELRQLDEMDLSYSAEFAIKASQVTESSERTENLEANEANQTATAAGEFFEGRAALAAAPVIEALVDELRHALSASERTDEARAHMLEIWTITEASLNEQETNELRSAVLAQVFGEPEAAIGLSRGGQAQGGGY
jgi:hypothetical protein